MAFRIAKNNRQNVENLKHTHVAILGAARSGIALAHLLRDAGARVLLSELNPDALPDEQKKQLEKRGVEIELGRHSEAVLKADLICISPGIPLHIPILEKAGQKGIPVSGELEVASWFCQAPIIAITGSNGKTTTTTLIGNILQKHFRRAIVAGNIGVALAEQLRKIPDPEIVVLEVSSFQLETITNFHPHVAVLLNISANHLDRYPDMEAYVNAKMRITRNLESEDVLIFNMDDALLRKRIDSLNCRKIPFSLRQVPDQGAYASESEIVIQEGVFNSALTVPIGDVQLRGPHNRYNMMAAALAAHALGAPLWLIVQELKAFSGIEHRLEPVDIVRGVAFYNDSKATTVEALKNALLSFHEPIVLIAGGKDKGGDFGDLLPLLKEKTRGVVVIGQASQRMYESWHPHVPVFFEVNLQQAVLRAFDLAEEGDAVLLSPACSSFDMFRDYEDRGRQFKQFVSDLRRRFETAGEQE